MECDKYIWMISTDIYRRGIRKDDDKDKWLMMICLTLLILLLFQLVYINAMSMSTTMDQVVKKAKDSLGQIFDKSLHDLVRGIRNHKDNEVMY
jgi:hypothetical protein